MKTKKDKKIMLVWCECGNKNRIIIILNYGVVLLAYTPHESHFLCKITIYYTTNNNIPSIV